MNRLKVYGLSACRLNITSSNNETEFSGVWIRGVTRDIILTVSHFTKDPTNTTAEAFSTYDANDFNSPSVKCELIHDFNDAMGKRDFAIFAPCSSENTRSPTQSITIAAILPEVGLLSTIAILFNYNAAPTAGNPNHLALPVQNCCCLNYWYINGLAVRGNLNMLNPKTLQPGRRTISVDK